MRVEVNNTPQYAEEYEYIVARVCDDGLWFWGAWHDGVKAEEVAKEVGGIVVQNK